MHVSTQQMSRTHSLGGFTPPLTIKDQTLERVKNFKLLGTCFGEDLKWTYHVEELVSSCYGEISTLRKVRNMTPQYTKKLLAESLVLCKLKFIDIVCHPLPA